MTKPLVRNAADPRQVREAKDTAAFRALEAQREIVVVMSSREGRSFLWRLLGMCHTYENVFSSDALVMARNAGEQNLGHRVLAELGTASPALLLRMQTEALTGARNEVDPTPTDEDDDA